MTGVTRVTRIESGLCLFLCPIQLMIREREYGWPRILVFVFYELQRINWTSFWVPVGKGIGVLVFMTLL